MAKRKATRGWYMGYEPEDVMTTREMMDEYLSKHVPNEAREALSKGLFTDKERELIAVAEKRTKSEDDDEK